MCMPRIWFAILTLVSAAMPQSPDVPEVRAHQTESSFRIRAETNLVTVRAVVRDTHGHTVGTLKREDFRVFDSGKPQELSGFTVETGVTSPATSPSIAGIAQPAVPPRAPQRFVGLFFDDLHMATEDVTRMRKAGSQYLTGLIDAEDRVAIFTSSRKDEVDFTADRDRLRAALLRLMSRSRTITLANQCPAIGEYQAYQIAQLQDAGALEVAVAEGYECNCNGAANPTALCADDQVRRARIEAAQIWNLADLQSQDALDATVQAIRRLAAMPGQRTLVLVSPGFLTTGQTRAVDSIIEMAVRHNVVINALDAAGLYTRPMRDWLTGANLALRVQKDGIENAALNLQRDVLAGLSAGTGGFFFQNSNNFDQGFRETAQAPESYYMLSFTPRDVEFDGKFHPLRVALNTGAQLRVEARRGYVASTNPTSGVELAFSQEELKGLAAELTTHVDTAGEVFTLTVRIHVDVGQLHLRQDGGRSVDTLKFETVLFDRDGKYVSAKDQSLELHLKDDTLARLTKEGINAVTKFQVGPGTYRVREIVRDTESKEVTALNANVQAAR